jgi:serine/threonine protein kinase
MSDNDASAAEPFGQIADEFVKAFRQGKRPSVEEFARRYPAHADEIREILPALVLMEQAKSAADTSAQPHQARKEPWHLIGNTVGPYRITAKLGAGGMGEVFLAEDTRLGRKAAIKFLPAELAAEPRRRQRFLNEARAASALNHPHVCVVYDVGETPDGLPYIAMEYVEGRPLDEVVLQGPLAISRVVEIALQVADALDAAHSRRIVHRDIKPGNISVNERGQVKVLDFGLAKWMPTGTDPQDGTQDSQQTQQGQVLGTPCYMSPEQALGKDLDHRSDIFSVGIVLYELATGQRPFNGPSFSEIVDNIVHAQPPAIGRLNYDIPPELERITLKCLQKQPDRRYQSARELMIDLQSLRHELDAGQDHGSTHGPSGEYDTQWDRRSMATGAYHAPAAAGEVSDPGELARSDVVITYANLDDQPLTSGRPGWISQLHQNLQVRVAQLSGKQVAVVKHSDRCASAETEAEILKQIPNAKTVVSVLSPPFAHSDGCHRLVGSFWKSATDSGQFEVQQRSRLLNVIKTPVDTDELPPDLRMLYTGLVPYEFFERDPLSGRLREFDQAFGNIALQRFHERVYDVAYDISQVLKYLGGPAHTGVKRTAHPKTIFLAATTSDLEPQRDQLRRELIELGHTVVPRQPLPLVASELMAVVQSCLAQADIAIHFVGEHFGLVPEATDLSMVALQNQVAARFCDNSSLKRLIWVPKGLEPRDERQTSFIRQLQSDPRTVTGAELIADTLENLKVLLRTRWEREQTESDQPAPTPAAGGAPRVYLICDRQDEAALEPLEDFFYDQGIEVSVPGFEANEAEVQKIHIRNLRDCDAALIYYGAAGMHWVDFKIRDLQKAAGYRDARPIPVSSVYVGPPFSHRKERFKSVSTPVIRQAQDAFAPELLTDFVTAIRQAKEAVS